MSRIFQSCFDDKTQMISLKMAQEKLLSDVAPVVETETVPLEAALGRVLAQDVISAINVPPHDNSAVDGYCVAFDEIDPQKDCDVPIMGRIAAGQVPPETPEKGAYRIFTGAPMPKGFDSVAMQEHVSRSGDTLHIPANCVTKKGANRRQAGEDIRIGQTLLKSGRRMDAFDVAITGAVGLSHLKVYRPLKVCVFSTGNEIQEPGRPLRAGAIYDINRYSLQALLKTLGCEVGDLGILPDDPKVITENLARAENHYDLIMTSGGVSVGEEDHVKACVEQLGAIHFWRVAIKPGRPVALGRIVETPFVGLPGNPVASAVTFMMLARPLICALSGRLMPELVKLKIPAAFELDHKGGRLEWQRAYLKETPFGPVIELFRSSGSGMMTSLIETDGLVELPATGCHIEPGDLVDFIPYSELLK